MDYNDGKFDRLALSGYTEGAINDREISWLKAVTGWLQGDSEHINDLYGLFFEGELGHGGQINDQWYEYLTLSGYDVSAHLTDMLYAFWTDTKVLPAPVTLAEALAALSTAVSALLSAVSRSEPADVIALLQRAAERALAAVRRAA